MSTPPTKTAISPPALVTIIFRGPKAAVGLTLMFTLTAGRPSVVSPKSDDVGCCVTVTSGDAALPLILYVVPGRIPFPTKKRFALFPCLTLTPTLPAVLPIPTAISDKAATVTLAEADFDGSATLVAVTVTVLFAGIAGTATSTLGISWPAATGKLKGAGGPEESPAL